MVKIEGLKKMYGRAAALDGLSMHVREGALYGFVGPNGAGKTTILRSIIRQLKPLGGVVFLDGKDLGRMGAKELS